MDEARVLERLDRIDALDRGGARPGELLAELRGLLRDAEALAREQPTTTNGTKEVVERLRTTPARDIIDL
jgi:hypothetical protein